MDCRRRRRFVARAPSEFDACPGAGLTTSAAVLFVRRGGTVWSLAEWRGPPPEPPLPWAGPERGCCGGVRLQTQGWLQP